MARQPVDERGLCGHPINRNGVRGCCYKCYGGYLYMVIRGRTTWEKLELEGKVRPKIQKRKSVREELFGLLEQARIVHHRFLAWGPTDDGTPQGKALEEALNELGIIVAYLDKKMAHSE